MGRNNYGVQAQAGAGNASNVGILGGKHDSVTCFSTDRDRLRRRADRCAGAQPGCAQAAWYGTVNMLIARLPNGNLDIFSRKAQRRPPSSRRRHARREVIDAAILSCDLKRGRADCETGFQIVCIVGVVGFLTPAFATSRSTIPSARPLAEPEQRHLPAVDRAGQGEGVIRETRDPI